MITVYGRCWPFKGYLNHEGYGNNNSVRTHRAVYEALVGPIPSGNQIDHLCRNRACYRPNHLEAVSPRENRERQEYGPPQFILP